MLFALCVILFVAAVFMFCASATACVYYTYHGFMGGEECCAAIFCNFGFYCLPALIGAVGIL